MSLLSWTPKIHAAIPTPSNTKDDEQLEGTVPERGTVEVGEESVLTNGS